jgi:AcrR family transcriptional regulator
MAIQDKNGQIVKAAQTVFAEFGFEKVTIDDVAKKAGMTRTALYYYYKSKVEIFTAVLFYEIEQYAEGLSTLVSNENPAIENLLSFCGRISTLKGRFRNVYKISTSDIHSIESRKIFCDIRTRLTELHGKIIEKILRNDRAIPRGTDFPAVSRIITESIRGISIYPEGRNIDDIRSDMETFCRIFYAGLVHGLNCAGK